MKIAAIILLVAAVAYARPGGKGKGSGDGDEEGMKVFFDLVKLCMRLGEEMKVTDDKRSWDEVLGKFAEVCIKVGVALEDDLNDDGNDKRSGPKSGDFDKPTPTGDPRSKGSKLFDGDDDDKKSGPRPTGEPMRPKKGHGSRTNDVDDEDKRSGPSPTGLPDSLSGRPTGLPDSLSGRPTGLPDSLSGPRPGPGKGKGKGKGRKSDNDERSVSNGGEKKPIAEELFNICLKLAKMGEENKEKRGEDELIEALKGMAEVCLGAFTEVQNSM